MYVVLPRQGLNWQTFVSTFTLQSFEALIDKLRLSRGTVRIPRFTMSYSVDLAGALKHLGMHAAFDARLADFREMAEVDFPLFIGQVLHKALINLNENGTEAAAATAIAMFGAAMPSPDKPFEFNANHPFLIVIRETTCEEILFLGAVIKPEKLEAPKQSSINQMHEDLSLEP
jgi:serpin B